MNNTVNYDGVIVPFEKLDSGILDRIIRNNIIEANDAVTKLPLWRYIIKPKDIVYDIGSYIGTHSIAFSICGGIVHAFEGSPKNFDRCEHHCKNFNVTVHKVALHEIKKQCLTRFDDCNWDDCGNQPRSMAHPEQLINYVILEDYCIENKIEWPNFIKMDIEGMETLVLKGFHLDKILSKNPIMYIEKHVGEPTRYSEYPSVVTVAEGGFDFNIIRNKWGYNIFKLSNSSLNKLEDNIDLNLVLDEIICIPK